MTRRFPILLGTSLCALLLAATPASAQGLDMSGGGGNRGPIEVLADNGIEWQQSTRQFTARGNATATRGEVTVRADELVASYRETAGGGTTLSTVEARGGVEIVTPQETAHGSQGNYDANTGIATLTGSVRIVRGDNVLTGSRAVVDMRSGVSTLQAGSGADGQGRARAVITPDGAPQPGQ